MGEEPILTNTHLYVSPRWVGEIVRLFPGSSVVRLKTDPEMVADERGLVHGGFTFGLADYAAMLAVNDPNVVLGSAEAKFIAPVRSGEILIANAEVVESHGKKQFVKCTVRTSHLVFEGTFTCLVFPKHIFDI